MTLLIGTDEGVSRAAALPFDRTDLVLECGVVHGLRTSTDDAAVYAAADDGLFRTVDAGETWEDLGLPVGDRDVWSVTEADDGTLFAGTNGPAVFRSRNGGASWSRLPGFEALPSYDRWQSPVDPDRARVRALESPPGDPTQVVVGVESGGFHVSDDAGDTWDDRRDRSPDDFHQVLALGPDVYVAATGYLDLDLEALDLGHALGLGGLHRTTDAGETWTRLDVGNEHAYTRSVWVNDGSLLFGAATMPPPDWMRDGADAALFETTGLGRTYEPVDYPGRPHAVVEAFTSVDGHAVLGTAAYPPAPDDTPAGGIVRRVEAGVYEAAGSVPSRVRSLAAV